MMKNNYGDTIMVSVICHVYNHENYVSDMLESIIAQVTDFRFEIIVHDDASTDASRSIIEEYAKKHPDTLIPIYQKTNQYSIDPLRILFALCSKASGKYIAMCEGDDYWIDVLKLQKQVDYMETHPGCSLCCHASQFVSADKSFLHDYYPLDESRLIDVSEIIDKGATFISTNTMMFSQRFMLCNLPDFCKITSRDYALVIVLALHGSVYYENEVMSAYRVFTPGSVTSIFEKNKKYRVRSARQTIKLLKAADKYSYGVYHDSFNKVIREYSHPVAKIYLYPIVANNKFLLKTWEWFKRNMRKY